MNDENKAEFDPYIGMVTAETWWLLGRRLSAFHPDEPEGNQLRAAAEWIDDLKKGGKENWYEDGLTALTPERLSRFATDVYQLLERKFRGVSIGLDVLARVETASRYGLREGGQFLELAEPPDVWWANEYRALFLELADPKTSPSWLSATGLCENASCQRFYIKQRSDQRFHSEGCRARAANQRAYQKRKARSHRR